MLILTTAHLDITLDHFFLFNYTSARNLVFTAFVCGFRKVDLRACKDRVKVNYFHLILSQREP